jgi:hypothetical protein
MCACPGGLAGSSSKRVVGFSAGAEGEPPTGPQPSPSARASSLPSAALDQFKRLKIEREIYVFRAYLMWLGAVEFLLMYAVVEALACACRFGCRGGAKGRPHPEPVTPARVTCRFCLCQDCGHPHVLWANGVLGGSLHFLPHPTLREVGGAGSEGCRLLPFVTCSLRQHDTQCPPGKAALRLCWLHCPVERTCTPFQPHCVLV